jgi:hypothetical protein
MPRNSRFRPVWSAACIAPIVAAIGCVWMSAPCHAGTPSVPQSGAGATSRTARDSALREMPLDKLSERDRQRVRDVVGRATLYRRLPTRVIQCDPQLYHLLLKKPELIVNIWDVMGVSNIELERTGKNTYQASDGQGTLAHIETLYESYERHVIYAEGSYQGSLFRRPLKAKCVMLLRSAHFRESDGKFTVKATLDTFIKVDRIGPEVLAKTFQPFVGKVADYNFTETMAFVSKLSRAAETRPRGIERLAQKLDKVDPQTRRDLIDVSQRMAADAYIAIQRMKARQASAKVAQHGQPTKRP